MSPIHLLMKVSTKPSRRVLKKALRIAHSSNQSLRIYAEDFKRSEDHTFLDFLIQGGESHARYDDFFVQWCSSILEMVEEIHEELELTKVDVELEHAKDSNWVKALVKDNQEPRILLVDYSTGVLAAHLLRELTRNKFNILLLTNKGWQQKLSIAAAIDPLHRGDQEANVDKAIITQSVSLKQRLNAGLSLVYCQFVAPHLYKHNQQILLNQKQAVQAFLHDNQLDKFNFRFIKGNPEQGLPQVVELMEASILALGACKRSALSRYWSGSTVDVLLKYPPCDLFLICGDAN
ncbi:hypothetical protein TW81_10965 [Vibrio galatheae]|uniref:UspA domain-containing protein n=1 Tax=Vibrio galatheae TaxID=579748 RepID=A0A0F4NHZ4_9VIBR|nr:universal stress protein [Vibrio galatheae]KJY82737.1 hypothetical protein TW81_10965 [Vibrio galatheae]